MKTFIFVTIVAAVGLLLFSSCNSVDGSRSRGGSPSKVTKQRSGTPRPYYGSNSEGNYYYRDGGNNADYQPEVKRYDPTRRNTTSPRTSQMDDRRKFSPLTMSPIDF